jgi:hypothetical protein
LPMKHHGQTMSETTLIGTASASVEDMWLSYANPEPNIECDVVKRNQGERRAAASSQGPAKQQLPRSRNAPSILKLEIS